MENAQLIGLSRQIALRRQLDVVANNVANLNTTGFKAQALLFEEYRMPVARHRDFLPNDQPLSYVQDWGTLGDFSAGAVVQTGSALDVALQGEGFLTVETPAGPRYTRAGALQINAEGVLVDLGGHPVLGEAGAIRFDPEETDITITPDGAVSTDRGAKGRLAMVEFETVHALTREGDNLFAGEGALPARATRIVQGALERSNVSGVAEMSNLIKVTRAYETLANLMQKQDEMRRGAIQRLGDLQA